MNLSEEISPGDPRTIRTVVAPLRMSMDPRNQPYEPISLFLALGCIGLAVPTLSQTTVTEFDPRIGPLKILLTLTLIPTLTLTPTLTITQP